MLGQEDLLVLRRVHTVFVTFQHRTHNLFCFLTDITKIVNYFAGSLSSPPLKGRGFPALVVNGCRDVVIDSPALDHYLGKDESQAPLVLALLEGGGRLTYNGKPVEFNRISSMLLQTHFRMLLEKEEPHRIG